MTGLFEINTALWTINKTMELILEELRVHNKNDVIMARLVEKTFDEEKDEFMEAKK
jgi:hypothetical protein